MSTLSKQVLENIALRMTEKSKVFKDKIRKEYEQLATDLYELTIPEEIKKAFKNYPDWFDTAGEIKLIGHGFDYEHVATTKRVVSNKGNYVTHFTLNASQGDKLFKAKAKSDKATKEYKQLFNETEQALYTLKTHKNIKENLPEAIPFLPPPMSNALVVNFNSLQKRLNKQPSVKELVPTN